MGESLFIEDKNTATRLLKYDRSVIAPAKSNLDAFPECEEKDLEKYILSICSPTLVIHFTFKDSDLIARKYQVLEYTQHFKFLCIQNVPYIPILFATLDVAVVSSQLPLLFCLYCSFFALCSLVFQTHFLLHVLIKCFGIIFMP